MTPHNYGVMEIKSCISSTKCQPHGEGLPAGKSSLKIHHPSLTKEINNEQGERCLITTMNSNNSQLFYVICGAVFSNTE